jgi:histidine ammonia-lyase
MKLEHALLRAALDGPVHAALEAADRAAIERSAAVVDTIVASGRTTYGINTGFGLLAQKTIAADQLATLQTNLILSHAAGVGAPLDDATVRLILLLKIAGLARGYSGVRLALVEGLAALLEHDVLPVIPEKGSVGASGDLAPLAHLSAALLGIGQVRHRGQVIDAAEGLRRAGLQPIQLRAKEGLALINGTQVSTALAIKGLLRIESVFAAAMVAGALSVDAALGSDAPFDPRIHEVRGQPGQIDVAGRYRDLLAGSAIRASHVNCDRVQDPYSLRCQPQVMGAALDLIRNAARTLVIEATAVTDNPLLFADTGEALSGGNFHAEPVAMAADTLAIAVAEIGALSERRLALLIDPSLSQLPAFLVAEPGLNSGFMIAQVTAAALASENKALAHPASVDSLPTSANQEDHVSMATFAARRLADMADNTTHIVAIELLAACQGIDFRAPLRTSPTLQRAVDLVRAKVPHYERDRLFSPDIETVAQLVRDDAFLQFVPDLLP